MKLEESTVLVVLHSFLSTFGFRTCYRNENHANFLQFPRRVRNFYHALSGEIPSIKSPVACLPKRLQKLSYFWQTVSIRASSRSCCLFSDYNTLADALLFLKQFSWNYQVSLTVCVLYQIAWKSDGILDNSRFTNWQGQLVTSWNISVFQRHYEKAKEPWQLKL